MQYKFHSHSHNIFKLINASPLVYKMFKIVASSLFAILLSSCASLNDGKSSQPSAPIQDVNLAENMSQAESINTDSLQTFLDVHGFFQQPEPLFLLSHQY